MRTASATNAAPACLLAFCIFPGSSCSLDKAISKVLRPVAVTDVEVTDSGGETLVGTGLVVLESRVPTTIRLGGLSGTVLLGSQVLLKVRLAGRIRLPARQRQSVPVSFSLPMARIDREALALLTGRRIEHTSKLRASVRVGDRKLVRHIRLSGTLEGPIFPTVLVKRSLVDAGVRVSNVDLSTRSDGAASLGFVVTVKNPFALDVDVQSLGYRVRLNGVVVGLGVQKWKARLPAGETGTLTVTFEPRLPALHDLFGVNPTSGLEIEGHLDIEPLGPVHRVPFLLSFGGI